MWKYILHSTNSISNGYSFAVKETEYTDRWLMIIITKLRFYFGSNR